MAIIARFFASARGVGLCVAVCGPLGACASLDASLPGNVAAALPADDAALRSQTEALGRRYDRDPSDKSTVLAYAAALRRQQQFSQAAAVLQREAARLPNDLDVLAAYGKALADAGRLTEAAEVLSHAHTPERPNWSVLSAQGSVADQLGDHAGAQAYYEAALKISPGEPTVLSNLGLSYALSKDLTRAEETLRRAVDLPGADARVRQNYALVLSLRGKFREAEGVSAQDLTRDAALKNVSTVRQTIVQPDTWAALRELAPREAAAKTAALELRPTL